MSFCVAEPKSMLSEAQQLEANLVEAVNRPRLSFADHEKSKFVALKMVRWNSNTGDFDFRSDFLIPGELRIPSSVEEAAELKKQRDRCVKEVEKLKEIVQTTNDNGFMGQRCKLTLPYLSKEERDDRALWLEQDLELIKKWERTILGYLKVIKAYESAILRMPTIQVSISDAQEVVEKSMIDHAKNYPNGWLPIDTDALVKLRATHRAGPNELVDKEKGSGADEVVQTEVPEAEADADDAEASAADDDAPVATKASLALGNATFEVDSSSPLDSRASETLGSGGCVAVGLSKLGVFRSEEVAKAALNAQIAIYAAKCRPDHAVPEHVGVPNVRWHPHVVASAVLETKHNFRKLDLASVDLASELKDGDFLVDGVLNDSFVKLVKGKAERYSTDPEDASSPRTNEAGWRHAIAVSDGRILEKEFDMSARWLWLGVNNRPDPDKGYMFKVLKVYRIFKCKSSCVGCKGQCANGEPPLKRQR